MTPRGVASVAVTPSGPAFTVVLVCHVAAVLLAMVVLAASALCAVRLLHPRGTRVPPSVRAYFSRGPNWAGRVLWLVPAFGAALLAMSGGTYRPGQDWVVAGFALWGAGVVLAELVVFPAERRIREGLASEGSPRPVATISGACRVVALSAVADLAVLVAGMVVMVAKP